MFFGTFKHRLNSKSQVTVPSRLRAQAPREGDDLVFYIVREDDRCLYLYTKNDLEEIFSAVRDKSMGNKEDFRRMFSSRVHDVECDPQGRILLPDELKRAVGIERDVVFVGNVDRVELWPAEKWQAYDDGQVKDYSRRMSEVRKQLFEW